MKILFYILGGVVIVIIISGVLGEKKKLPQKLHVPQWQISQVLEEAREITRKAAES